jgi:hypothetical protein
MYLDALYVGILLLISGPNALVVAVGESIILK